MGFGTTEFLILAVLSMLVVVPFWKICTKAGFPGALSLTQLVPILNFLVLFYLAFAEWPVHRQLNEMRRRSGPGPT